MNKKSYKAIAYFVLFIVTLCAMSCEKFDDRHKQFFENGEITYIAKADSLVLSGGYNRIQLSWLLLSDPKIYKYKVYWNNRQDSIENLVQKTADVDTVRLMLNNMPEGTYHFEIFTYDKIGNTSVVTSADGKVYGEIYQHTLLPRTYKSVRRLGDGVEFNWMQADEDLVKVEVTYTDQDGEVIHQTVSKKAELDTLHKFPAGGSFQYRSVFMPDTNALDTFYTEPKTYTVSTSVINWNDYSMIFGHHDYLLARNAAGELMRFPNNGSLGFQAPIRVNAGWDVYDMIFSYPTADGLIARVTNTGTGSVIRRYTLNAAGAIGAAVQLGTGWQGFDQVITYGPMLITRSAGVVKRYPLNANWAFTPANTVISGFPSPGDYTKMLGGLNGILAITSDGKLWNIPLGKELTAVAGARRLISEGWNQYDLVSTLEDNLLARKPNGELWMFPMLPNGDLGEGTLTSNLVENWN